MQIGYMKMWVNGKLRRVGRGRGEMVGGAGKRKRGEGWRGKRIEGCAEVGRYKVAFWNVAGVKNKDGGFWKGLEEWDILVLCETWVEEREWDKVRNKLPKGYVWWMQGAKRESKKGRAIGGMIMGVREGIETREGEEGEKEGIMMRKVKMGGSGRGWWACT